MSASLWRALRLLTGRPALILGAGMVLAVIAETSSIGLLGLSGWYIASCFLFGIGRLPGFSYLGPSGGVRGLAISRITARYAQNLVSHHATLAWLTRLRTRLFCEVAKASPDRLRRLGTGQVLDRAMSDADTVDRVLIRAVTPVVLAATTVTVTVAAVASVSTFTALALASGAAITAALAVRLPRHDSPTESRGRARARVVDSVDAWEELVCLGATADLRTAALHVLRNVANDEDRRERAKGHAHTIVGLMIAATTVAALGVPRLTGQVLSLPTATLTALLVVGALETVIALPEARDAWRTAADAAARLGPLSANERAARAGEAGLGDRPAVAVRNLPLVPYPPDGCTARTSANIEAGSFTVVQGRSGSGKTTLLRFLAGDLRADDATITIADRPPRDYRPGQIVLVASDDHLFACTVAENLRIADPGLSDARIAELLEAMFLLQRNVSPETALGPGGRMLSGGEHRRLCLARAVAARPRLLLLDEPTEGLDAATARHVLDAIRALLPDATIVTVVHDRDLDIVTDVADHRLDLDNVTRVVAERGHAAAKPARMMSVPRPAGAVSGGAS